jgi:hypothetical protein
MITKQEQEMVLHHGCYLAGVEPLDAYFKEAGTLFVIRLDKRIDALRLADKVAGHVKKCPRGAFEVSLLPQIELSVKP